MSPALRRTALCVLLAVGPLVAGYACSDFSSESMGDTADAGPEAQTSMEAAAPDAGGDGPSDDGAKGVCDVHAIATGYAHSCAVFGAKKSVACWGNNDVLECGADLDAGSVRASAGLVPNLEHVSQLALGIEHSCALKEDGTVWCWGANNVGQLGNASADGLPSSVPTQVYGITSAAQISSGYEHTCARLADGTVKCWGFNASGQLGDGTQTSRAAPVSADVSGVAEIAVGALHACARLSDGGVVCWGDNYDGELGIGGDDAGPDASAPKYAHLAVEKIDAGPAVRLGSGSASNCAQFQEAPSLRCWGNNGLLILVPNVDSTIVGTPTAVMIPFVLDGGTLVTGGYQTCAVAADHALFCWGAGVYGQTGSTTIGGPPSRVVAAGAVDDVATGLAHTCVLSDASISCFGWNQFGQLGQGTYDVPPEGGTAPPHTAPQRVSLPCF